MNKPSDKEISDILKVDPLVEAEKATGKSYKEDDATMNLGFLLNVQNNLVKENALKSTGDSVFSMDWLAYCEFVENLGFGLMIEDFNEDGTESVRIYYHEKDGLLLKTDSFNGNRNSAIVYYNWRPDIKPKEEWKDPNKVELADWGVTSSGSWNRTDDITDKTVEDHWRSLVWSGDHDAREALSFNMRQLRENGTFMPIWKNRPFLWLLGHWESKGEYSYAKINESRIKKLPEWVQDAITPNKEKQ
jgi:hypothetical protein